MSAPSWADLEALFHEALARAPADRAAFLVERCVGRPDLQAEVDALLRAHNDAASALEVPSVPLQTRLKAGARIGSYEVLAELGAGGMGEVYRARDPKLGREVAIKVLPAVFLSDPERRARFEREARVLASLNHPHIGAIYGVEDAGGVPALVLELVEGETLADRLTRGAIPIGEALTVARQIADALEAAHEKGIVHRDLKPANIILQGARGPTPTRWKTATSSVDSPPRESDDIVVKVLDFGLAKVYGDGPGPDLAQSPTVTASGTREGTILGTPAYMSPEQVRGKPTDRRTDIWAFGCVLYEMLTGHTAFARETISDTIAAILGRGPDWQTLPETTPASVRRLLQRCLERDSKRRLRDIGDARIDLDDGLTGGLDQQAIVSTSSAASSSGMGRTMPTQLACIWGH